MTAKADRPTAQELAQLPDLLSSTHLKRQELASFLRQLEEGLLEHARELDRSGGLLDDDEKAARMSLAREDERLRHEVSLLAREIGSIRREIDAGISDDDLRGKLKRMVAGLQGHRDAEVGLVLESVDTEVGSGD